MTIRSRHVEMVIAIQRNCYVSEQQIFEGAHWPMSGSLMTELSRRPQFLRRLEGCHSKRFELFKRMTHDINGIPPRVGGITVGLVRPMLFPGTDLSVHLLRIEGLVPHHR